MAEVVRWFKSGEVEIRKFSPLNNRDDDGKSDPNNCDEMDNLSQQHKDSKSRVSYVYNTCTI